MEFIIIGVVAAMMVGLVFWQARSRKRMSQNHEQMVHNMRPGMRVRTVSGLIGRIVEIREEAPQFTTILLETGTDKGGKSFLLFDIGAISAVIDDEMLQRAREEKARLDAEKRIEDNKREAEQRIADAKTIPVVDPTVTTDSQANSNDSFDAATFVEKSNNTRNTKKRK